MKDLDAVVARVGDDERPTARHVHGLRRRKIPVARTADAAELAYKTTDETISRDQDAVVARVGDNEILEYTPVKPRRRREAPAGRAVIPIRSARADGAFMRVPMK